MCDYSRYLARRTLLLKAFVLLYTVFNTQVGFPGVLNAMHGGDGPCTIAFVLRYINAQPLLTSCVVTMVRACNPQLCLCRANPASTTSSVERLPGVQHFQTGRLHTHGAVITLFVSC